CASEFGTAGQLHRCAQRGEGRSHGRIALRVKEFMNGLLQDLRYALRQLRKSPGFNVSAVFILALMVGAASAVFSVIYAELIRPLPYANPERIFCLQPYAAEGYQQSVSYPDYIDWRRENHAFSALAAYGAVSSNFEGPAGPA